jgi:hypothetical protein
MKEVAHAYRMDKGIIKKLKMQYSLEEEIIERSYY